MVGFVATRIIVNIYLRRTLPKRKAEIGPAVGKMVSGLFSFSELGQKLTDEKSIGKIIPEAEQHVDHFLRTKLKTAFPIIGSFIGDKTINQLKDVFMNELKEILPDLLRKYIQNLEKDLDIEKIVSDRIAALPDDQTEGLIKKLKAQMRPVYNMGTLVSLIIGVIEVLIVYGLVAWSYFFDPLVPGP
jgi:uncharacterized membrane protein YheB (UPF0754 family)